MNNQVEIEISVPSEKFSLTAVHDGVDMRPQFILKNIENEWKIDEVKYGFSNETTWHTDGI